MFFMKPPRAVQHETEDFYFSDDEYHQGEDNDVTSADDVAGVHNTGGPG